MSYADKIKSENSGISISPTTTDVMRTSRHSRKEIYFCELKKTSILMAFTNKHNYTIWKLTTLLAQQTF